MTINMRFNNSPRTVGRSRRLTFLPAVALSALLATGCQPQTEAPALPPELSLDTDLAKASYSLAYNMSQSMRERLPADIDAEAYAAGAKDGLVGVDRKVSEEEAQRTLTALAEQAQEAARVKAEESSKTNSEYLAANAGKDGVESLPSGLQYQVLTAAPEGAKQPSAEDTVEVHYHGTLTNGTVFDSSVERGETIKFPLSGVIAGWTEGLQLMGEGAKWRLFIPPSLGYGERPAGEIPPNSTLIFDVELIAIQ
jgi:FKBP-type peptidyl-prolyl cis-trans isomerase FklB